MQWNLKINCLNWNISQLRIRSFPARGSFRSVLQVVWIVGLSLQPARSSCAELFLSWLYSGSSSLLLRLVSHKYLASQALHVILTILIFLLLLRLIDPGIKIQALRHRHLPLSLWSDRIKFSGKESLQFSLYTFHLPLFSLFGNISKQVEPC